MAEDTIPQHYVDAFERNLGMLPQQLDSRLVSRVTSNLRFMTPGDRFNADDIGLSEPTEIEDRFGVSPSGSVDKRRRVGVLIPYDDGKFLDDVDTAKSLSDPSNETMQAMLAGQERYRDRAIIAAALGTSLEGRRGETPIALPGAQVVAVNSHAYYPLNLAAAPSGNAPLTYSKVLEAKVKLDKAEILNAGERTMITSATQIGQMLRDPALTSSDYNSVKSLLEGNITRWAGFNWVQTELLPLAAGVRTSIALVKSAVVYKARPLTEATITKRADRKFNWYAYYKGFHGAVRRYDEGVVSILCTET